VLFGEEENLRACPDIGLSTGLIMAVNKMII